MSAKELNCVMCNKSFKSVRAGTRGRFPGFCSDECRKNKKSAQKPAKRAKLIESSDDDDDDDDDGSEYDDDDFNPRDEKDDVDRKVYQKEAKQELQELIGVRAIADKKDDKNEKNEKNEKDDKPKPPTDFAACLRELLREREEFVKKVAVQKGTLVDRQKNLKRKMNEMEKEISTINSELTQLAQLE